MRLRSPTRLWLRATMRLWLRATMRLWLVVTAVGVAVATAGRSDAEVPVATPAPGAVSAAPAPLATPLSPSRATPAASAKPAAPTRAPAADSPPSAESRQHLLTQLSWVFGDEEVLHTSSTLPFASPAAAFGERQNYRLIGDDLLAQPRDRSNWLLWTTKAWLSGYWANVSTGAELALAFDLAAPLAAEDARQRVQDAGTALAVRYDFDGHHSLELRGYPLDSVVLRLGYLEALTWGKVDADIGESVFPRALGAAPGARVAYRGPAWTAFAAVKTAQILERSAASSATQAGLSAAESNYAGFVGLEWQPQARLTLGVEGAYAEHGPLPDSGPRSERAFSFGAAARVVVAEGLLADSVLEPRWRFSGLAGTPLELGLARSEQGRSGWLLALEALGLEQRLRSFEGVGETRFQSAWAAGLQASWRFHRLHLGALLLVRSPAFVLRYGPSLVPFQTLPVALEGREARTGVASLGVSFWQDRLRPEVQLALERPASLTSRGPGEVRTLVVNDARERSIIVGEGVPLTLQGRMSLRAALSPQMAVLGWIQCRRETVSHISDAVSGERLVSSLSTTSLLGFGLAGQTRF